mmetsp:Transcript_30130/g.71690  ORF Transcript_30130/g.71690 Transcript_30130/m.71690 type:complete len:99 (+) Transcript_30130:251-547(+)
MTDTTKRPRANSKGEELFLIHLKRNADDDGDRDEPPKTPRRNRKTIGEELWAIHQVRSRGLPPDLDVDDDSDANREETPKVKKYYLRSRKGKKPNADN